MPRRLPLCRSRAGHICAAAAASPARCALSRLHLRRLCPGNRALPGFAHQQLNMGRSGGGLAGLGGLLVALALAAAPPAALGQGHYDGADIREEKPFGSRIRRPYVTGAAPARTYSRLDILNSGAFTLGQFLQRLPGQGSGANQRHLDSDGSVRMDFHHLGAARTLVLVNGRRWVNGGRGADSSPDLDAIPLAMVQRVEVLTGSASAVYGSGAMGGAINIVTREGGEGLDFRLLSGSYSAGGTSGDSYQLTYGSQTRSGRTSLMLGASVQNSGQVLASERPDAAAAPLQGLSAHAPRAASAM